MNNPIRIDAGAVAQDCLNMFNLMNNINMTIMQLAIFTRVYRTYTPDDGDGVDPSENSIFNAMLVQMGYQLGLNRDPDNFTLPCNDPKLNNLSLKIWYFLLILDMNNAMLSGMPLNILPADFDNKTPYYVAGNENNSNSDLEKFTVEKLELFKSIYYLVTDIIRISLNINIPVQVSQLV